MVLSLLSNLIGRLIKKNYMFCSNRMFIKNELGTIGTSDYKQVLKAV